MFSFFSIFGKIFNSNLVFLLLALAVVNKVRPVDGPGSTNALDWAKTDVSTSVEQPRWEESQTVGPAVQPGAEMWCWPLNQTFNGSGSHLGGCVWTVFHNYPLVSPPEDVPSLVAMHTAGAHVINRVMLSAPHFLCEVVVTIAKAAFLFITFVVNFCMLTVELLFSAVPFASAYYLIWGLVHTRNFFWFFLKNIINCYVIVIHLIVHLHAQQAQSVAGPYSIKDNNLLLFFKQCDPAIISIAYVSRWKMFALTNKGMHSYNGNMMMSNVPAIAATELTAEEQSIIHRRRNRQLANADIVANLISNNTIIDSADRHLNIKGLLGTIDGDANQGFSGLGPALQGTKHPHFGYQLFSFVDVLDGTNVTRAIEDGNIFGPETAPIDFVANMSPLQMNNDFGRVLVPMKHSVNTQGISTDVTNVLEVSVLTGQEIDITTKNLGYHTFSVPPLVNEIENILTKTGVEGFGTEATGRLSRERSITKHNVSSRMARRKHISGGTLRSFFLKIFLDYFSSLTIEASGGITQFTERVNGGAPVNNTYACDVVGEDLIITPTQWDNIMVGTTQLFSLPEGYQSTEHANLCARYAGSYPAYRATRNRRGAWSHGKTPVAQMFNIPKDGNDVIFHTGYQSANHLQNLGGATGYLPSHIIKEFLMSAVVITGAYKDFTWAQSASSLMMSGLPLETFDRENGGDGIDNRGINGAGSNDCTLPLWSDYVSDLPKSNTAYAYFNCYRESSLVPHEVMNFLNVNDKLQLPIAIYHSLCVHAARQVAFHALGLTGTVMRSNPLSGIFDIAAKGRHFAKVTQRAGYGTLHHIDEVTIAAMDKMFGFTLPLDVLSFWGAPDVNGNHNVANYVRASHLPTPLDQLFLARLARALPIAWDIPHHGSVMRRPVDLPWLNDATPRLGFSAALPMTTLSDEMRPFVPDEDLVRNINILVWRLKGHSTRLGVPIPTIVDITAWRSRALWELPVGAANNVDIRMDNRTGGICLGLFHNTWIGHTGPECWGFSLQNVGNDAGVQDAMYTFLYQRPSAFTDFCVLPADFVRRDFRIPNEIAYPQIEISRPNIPLSAPQSKIIHTTARTAVQTRSRLVGPMVLVEDMLPMRPLLNVQRTTQNAAPVTIVKPDLTAPSQAPASVAIVASSNHNVDATNKELMTLLASLTQVMASLQQTLNNNASMISRTVAHGVVDPQPFTREAYNVTVNDRRPRSVSSGHRSRTRSSSRRRGRSPQHNAERPWRGPPGSEPIKPGGTTSSSALQAEN